MFDLDLSSPSTREEYLCNPLSCLAVHHGDTTPISAHPYIVSPYCEASASGVGMRATRYWDLDLCRVCMGVCLGVCVCVWGGGVTNTL